LGIARRRSVISECSVGSRGAEASWQGSEVESCLLRGVLTGIIIVKAQL
jgi:hypothetical protein